MKKLFLTSIAALFLATGAAHAADALICGQEQGSCRSYKEPLLSPNQLPKAMLGKWCEEDRQKEFSVYNREPSDGCTWSRELFTVSQRGFEEVDNECTFRKIARKDIGIYLVTGYCDIPEDVRWKYAPKKEGDEHNFEGSWEFEIIDEQLHIRNLSEE